MTSRNGIYSTGLETLDARPAKKIVSNNQSKRKKFFKALSEFNFLPIAQKDIILTFEGIKPVVRITIREKYEEDFIKFCRKYELSLVKSEYKTVAKKDIGKGRWRNKILKRVSRKSKRGIFFFYLSKDKQHAERAKIEESAEKTAEFGKSLGFPACDIKFFIEAAEEAEEKQMDFVLFALENTPGSLPYNFWNNNVSQYFGYSLLSHFPHSFNCRKSAMLSRKYYDVLKKYSKKFAGKFVETQKSAIIFTEYRGIFLMKNFILKNNILYYSKNGINETLKNKIYRNLMKGNNIKINSKNYFEIRLGNKILQRMKGNNYGILVFGDI